MSIAIKWKHDHVYRGKAYKAGAISDVDPSDYQTLVKAWLWAERYVAPDLEIPKTPAPVVETAALESPGEDPATETTALSCGGKKWKKSGGK